MDGDSLKLNFEIALEKINTLTDQNHELMNKIEQLKFEIAKKNEIKITPITAESRFEDITDGADAAMKRYQQFLKKEFPNAKSKQSQGQPVWERNS